MGIQQKSRSIRRGRRRDYLFRTGKAVSNSVSHIRMDVRIDKIKNKQRYQDYCNRKKFCRIYLSDPVIDDRRQEVDKCETCKSEYEKSLKTDPAVYVKEEAVVVPPLCPERILEYYTRDVLKCSAQNHGGKEVLGRALSKREKEDEYGDAARAVDRKPRAVQDTSVNVVSLKHVVVDNFPYPAEARVDEEHCNQ